MKVYFKKSYNYYEINLITECDHFDRNRASCIEWSMIIKKIKNIFKSAITHDMIVLSGRGHIFSFKEEADEAFFILWSSDGIEI